MTTKEIAGSKGHLLKVLGIGFGLAISIGSAIGVGILRSPGLIAGYIDSAWLVMLAWVIGGVYCLLAANVLCELATMMPRSGGGYVYTSRGLGKFAGFVVGVCDWFQTTAALAFLSVVFGEYASRLLVPNLTGGRIIFSVGVLLTLSALNWIGVRTGSEMQMLTSLLKALALIAFVVACFLFGGQTPLEATSVATDAVAPSFTFAYAASFVLGLQLVLGTYEGWQGPVYFSEENTDPSSSIPRSLYGGILLIIAIYFLVNLALIYVMPMSRLAGSQFAGGDAMALIFGERGGQLLTVLALLSIVGILNAYLMANPRIVLALARDAMLPSQLAAVNTGGTPYVGLLVVTIAAATLATIGSFELLIAIAQFFAVSISILLTLTFFVLRRREPNAPRPYRAWGYPLAPLLVLLIAVALFVGYAVSNPWPSLYAITAVVLSYPVFIFIRRD